MFYPKCRDILPTVNIQPEQPSPAAERLLRYVTHILQRDYYTAPHRTLPIPIADFYHIVALSASIQRLTRMHHPTDPVPIQPEELLRLQETVYHDVFLPCQQLFPNNEIYAFQLLGGAFESLLAAYHAPEDRRTTTTTSPPASTCRWYLDMGWTNRLQHKLQVDGRLMGALKDSRARVELVQAWQKFGAGCGLAMEDHGEPEMLVEYQNVYNELGKRKKKDDLDVKDAKRAEKRLVGLAVLCGILFLMVMLILGHYHK